MTSKQAGLFDGPARAPSATFSLCEEHGPECRAHACQGRRYRYLLRWPTQAEGERICLWVLANPSTASAEETDPTIRRCIAFSRAWGFGWCHVVNVRAWRATDPKDVPPDPRAIGAENDEHINIQALLASRVVCGWGKLGGARGALTLAVIRASGRVPHALRLNHDGSPAHPLYLPNSVQPFPVEAP